MPTGYSYSGRRNIQAARDAHEAIEISTSNYVRGQLGWTREACQRRIRREESRAFVSSLIAGWEAQGWRLAGRSILDIGCGQGSVVLELLHRSIDALGVEPGAEFRAVSHIRLEEAGFDANRVLPASGSALPFSSHSFDYVISLQVLEHVACPEEVLREIFRVLKPGGRFYLSCENYLSFREQHYRVRWLPLFPKSLASVYLSLRGRDPSFLREYVFYTTYPKILRICRAVGFYDETLGDWLEIARSAPRRLPRRVDQWIARVSRLLPEERQERFLLLWGHSKYFFRTGVRLYLQKPTRVPSDPSNPEGLQ